MSPASFTAESLRAVLEEHTPAAATGFVVAVSGGGDSAALAAALAAGGRPIRGLPLRAVHVDHGLQPAAVEFRRACERSCRTLRIPLSVLGAVVDASPGVSIEAAARAARYAVLGRDLAVGECLLTAHHAQDQAETVLLQLLRGAGLKGLSAMPTCREFHLGWHLRPLLEVPRRDLEPFAVAAGLGWVSDPMNADVRFDRAYLRAQVWPALAARWRGAAQAVSRSAQHIAEAQALLDRRASERVDKLRDGATLSVAGLRSLEPAERVHTVRFWIARTVPVPPPAARLNEALRQMIEADDDQLPAVVWGAHALRRYRGRLFLTAAQPPRLAAHCVWPAASSVPVDLGALGSLCLLSGAGGLKADLLPALLTVCRRRGGETLQPGPRARTQTVQHLCQRLGVPPWLRDALPLVYARDELIAVGDLWLDARWCVAAGATGLRVVWHGAPLVL